VPQFLEAIIFLSEGQWYFCITGSQMENQRSCSCAWCDHVYLTQKTCRILQNSNMLLHLDPMPPKQIHHLSLKGFQKRVATRHKMMTVTWIDEPYFWHICDIGIQRGRPSHVS
jgi:hypothetical protein